MNGDLDWTIEGQPEVVTPAGPSVWRRRRLWVLLAALLLPLLALGGLTISANRRQAELADQVRRVAKAEEAAQRSGNISQFLALQDRTDEAWLELQDSRLKQSNFYTVPELGLGAAGDPVSFGAVTLEDGFARLEVTRTFNVTNSAGIARSVMLAMPQFYRPWGSSWVRAWPSPEWWGSPQTFTGQRLSVVYPARDAADVLPLAARLDGWADLVCADWGCPDNARYTIEFTPSVGALLQLNRARFDGRVLTLPVPALVARPLGTGKDDPIATGTGRLLVWALAMDLSGSYRLPLLDALAEAEQSRLGLAPQPKIGDIGLVTTAWRNGWIGFPDSFRPIAAEAILAFMHDTYPDRGERALLAALRPLGSPMPQLAAALDLTPNMLTEAWLAYGQTHWSDTAGRPPPQGEVALACGDTVKLRDLASGTTQELTTLSSGIYPVPLFGVQPLTWSADGTWLAITAGRGHSYETARLKNLVTGEERDLGRGWFVAWAPHGDRYAVYRPDLDQTLIYSLSGGPGQALPGEPSIVAWSPSGDRLTYVAHGVDGAGVTIWVAAGDGTQAHPLVRGFAPLWSPDSSSLAYLPASPSGAPALSIVDVSTGVTRTLLTTSDLSTDLSAPGFASERTWVTVIYPVAWSPDGATLAASVALDDSDGTHMGLVTLRADGGRRRLWLVASWVGRISWSPDSRHLSALTRDYAESPRQIIPMRVWTAAIDSGTPSTVEGANRWWSPDGQWLAVDQSAGSAIFSADLGAVWRLPPGCKIGGWRPK